MLVASVDVAPVHQHAEEEPAVVWRSSKARLHRLQQREDVSLGVRADARCHLIFKGDTSGANIGTKRKKKRNLSQWFSFLSIRIVN
jgi:hypothetical protein